VPAPAVPVIQPSALGGVSLVLAVLGTAFSALAYAIVTNTELDGLTFFAILYVPVLAHLVGVGRGVRGIFLQTDSRKWMAYVGALLNLYLAVYQLGAPWS